MGAYPVPGSARPRRGVIFERRDAESLSAHPLGHPFSQGFIRAKWVSGTTWGKNLPELDNLTDQFRAAGYQTASFGKQHYCSTKAAFDKEESFVYSEEVHALHYAERFNIEDYNVVQYPPKPYSWIFAGRFPAGTERKAESKAVAAAKTWLTARDQNRPFLLRLSFNAPHTPVVPPAPFDTLIDPDSIALPSEAETTPSSEPDWIADSLRSAADASRLTRDQIRRMRQAYYGEVAFVDNLIESFLDWMSGRGLLDNTIVAFVSDHGTHLGDYGLVQKQTFYEPAVKVPYLFWFPQEFARGIQINTPVETRTLVPTLLEAAGVDMPERCKNLSLAPTLLNGAKPQATPVFSELTLGSFGMRPDDRLVMVRDGNWKMSLCFSPELSDGTLHNLNDDPYERENLYDHTKYATIQNRLTSLIEKHLSTGTC